MIIAIKYNEDDYFGNEFYAKVGGITKIEMDKLEYEFLIRSDYKLFVDEEVYGKYNNYLITAHENEEEEESEDSLSDTNNNTNTNGDIIEEDNTIHVI